MIPPPAGFHGGGGFRAGESHVSGGGFRGAGGFHPLPPIAGTIHERGGQSFVTGFGHTNTGIGRPVFHVPGVYEVGRTYGAEQHWAGTGPQQRFGGYDGPLRDPYGRGRWTGYGRSVYGRERARDIAVDRERYRLAAARRAGAFGYGGYGGFADGGYGGAGYDAGGYDSSDIGSAPAAGTYTGAGLYDGNGSYAGAGSFGDAGSYPAPGVYQSELAGAGFTYRSETPLAARYAEAPLAPSPYGGFDAGNSYADAASRDVGPGVRARYTHVSDRASGCTCDRSARTTPTIFRYGIGTAY